MILWEYRWESVDRSRMANAGASTSRVIQERSGTVRAPAYVGAELSLGWRSERKRLLSAPIRE